MQMGAKLVPDGMFYLAEIQDFFLRRKTDPGKARWTRSKA
jgi:hypothetical protein